MKIEQGSLEHWAAKKPHEPAIIEEDGTTLTWGEWNRRANLLADALVKAGLKEQDVVAVRTRIRSDWFVANRALAKIGCIHLMVNWRLTPSEVRYMLEDSGAKAIIFDDEDPRSLATAWKNHPLKIGVSIGTEVPVPGVVRYEEIIARTDVPHRESGKVRPENIIYTSGTTGKPKGVFLPPEVRKQREKELTEYLQDIGWYQAGEPGNRTMVSTPLHHGLGPLVAGSAHAIGNTVILQNKFDPEKTLQLIEKYRVTHWTCVPTMLKRIASLPKEVLDKYDVSSIQSLRVGAAPVPMKLKEWVVRYFGDHCLYEGYGASEVGLVTIMPPHMHFAKPGSCGFPYKHVSISIRDEDGRVLKTGQTGEIWVKTPQTIDRYLNRPPLGPDMLDADGYFNTGDIGYLDEDGYLYVTDRKKDMIISGGVNIYPAEIEEVLQAHPAVQDVAVIGIPDDDMGEKVKAFVELKPGMTVTEEELLAFCANDLATYKRPRDIEFVDELPRNTVGKVLKYELRAPYWTGRERKI